MTSAEQSEASPKPILPPSGFREGVSDTEFEPDLCETHRNGSSLDEILHPLPEGGEPPEMEGRGVYRLLFVVLLLVVGILTDSRRLVDAASLMLP